MIGSKLIGTGESSGENGGPSDSFNSDKMDVDVVKIRGKEVELRSRGGLVNENKEVKRSNHDETTIRGKGRKNRKEGRLREDDRVFVQFRRGRIFQSLKIENTHKWEDKRQSEEALC